MHEVQNEFDDLLNFVFIDSRNTQAYEVERTIWKSLLQLGYLLLKAWFQLRCEQYGRKPLVSKDRNKPNGNNRLCGLLLSERPL